MLGAIFLLLTAASIGYLGLVQAPALQRAALDTWRHRLEAMADDREAGIERWVADFVADTRTLASYPTAVYRAGGSAGPPYPFDPTRGAEQHLSDLYDAFVQVHGYEAAALYGVADAGPLVGTSSHPELAAGLAAAVVERGDPRAGLAPSAGRLFGGAPVRSSDGTIVGAVIVEADATDFLYPLLRSEPAPTETGEALLATITGDSVLYLSPLRKRPSGTWRGVAVDPGGRMASAGSMVRDTIGTFRDYAGEPVLAATRPVDGTAWHLVVKVDVREALADYRTNLRTTTLAIAGLLLGLLGAGLALWRWRLGRYSAAIWRERSRLAALLDHASDVILFTDADLTIREANRRAEEFYGRPREELLGLSARELRPPELRSGVDRTIREVEEEGAGLVETEHQVAGGERVPVEISLRRVDLDERIRYIAMIRDIRERHALEQQLRQSQKMEAVGRLAGGVAHDFNNVITSIQGHAALAADGLPADDPLRSDLEEIARSVDRASSLTRQLLAFSRRQILRPRVIDVGSVVDSMQSMLRRLISEDIRLVLSLPDTAATIEADPGQIQQVVLNLVVNARDALPEGGTVRIQVHAPGSSAGDVDPAGADEDAGRVTIVVSDTGVGMDAETRERIFEPFYTTKGTGGTGLGLATVYGIVDQSGGRIDVVSEPGAGTRFTVSFPYVDAEPEPSTGPETPVKPGATGTGGGTIVIAEDEDGVRAVAARALERQGFDVLTASSGTAALDVIEQADDTVDLLITDVVMPGMSGTALARRVQERRPRCRVLYMSGYTEEEAIRDVALPPGTDFLDKPFTPAQLVAAVRRILDQKQD